MAQANKCSEHMFASELSDPKTAESLPMSGFNQKIAPAHHISPPQKPHQRIIEPCAVAEIEIEDAMLANSVGD